jgi:hypothetical protein
LKPANVDEIKRESEIQPQRNLMQGQDMRQAVKMRKKQFLMGKPLDLPYYKGI